MRVISKSLAVLVLLSTIGFALRSLNPNAESKYKVKEGDKDTSTPNSPNITKKRRGSIEMAARRCSVDMTAKKKGDSLILSNDVNNADRRRSSTFASTNFHVIANIDDDVDLTPRLLLATGVFALAFSVLGFFTSYAQLLNKATVAPDLYYSHIEEAQRLLNSPDVAQPCIDNFQEACYPQYAYSSFFGLCSVYLTYNGLSQILSVCAPSVMKPSSRTASVQPENQKSEETSSRFASITSSFSVAKKAYKETWMGRNEHLLQPGGDLFLLKCLLVTLFIDIPAQILRCFFVEDSYATSSAEHTITQLVLMTFHFNVFLFAFYSGSELGCMSANWFADLAYLMVRLSVSGSLAMKATGLVDFITIAIPFVFCGREINHVVKFLRQESEDDSADDEKSKKAKKDRAKISIPLSLAATVGGIILTHIAVQKSNQYDGGLGCEKQLFPNDDDSIRCNLFRFNFFYDPACSCEFIEWTVTPIFDCGHFVGDPDHKSFKESPQIEVESFLGSVRSMQISFHPDCPMIEEDWEMITSCEELRALILRGPDIKRFEYHFKKLSNLVSLRVQHSNLEEIDDEALSEWTYIEDFACTPCPYFESIEDLLTGDLPRLNSVEVYGAPACPDINDFDYSEELVCVSQNETNVCDGMPNWFANYWIDRAKSVELSTCFEFRCEDLLPWYELTDAGEVAKGPDAIPGDGLLHWQTFHGMMSSFLSGPLTEDYNNFPEDAWHCLFSQIREAVNANFEQDIPEGATPANGMTSLEWVSIWTGYGNCGDCQVAKDMIEAGKEKFAKAYGSETSVPQACIDSFGNTTNMDLPAIIEHCLTTDTACVGLCSAGTPIFSSVDADGNRLINEQEFIQAAAMTGFGRLAPPGIYDCIEALAQNIGEECITKSEEGEKVLEFGQAVSIGMWVVGSPKSICSDC